MISKQERPRGTWVQTDRAAHEAWSALIEKSPVAARIMHLLVAQVGKDNAVVISQDNLARLVNRSPRSVKNAVAILRKDRWVQVRQIGGRGTVNAYIINDQVAWHGKRDGIRYSEFSARVIVSDNEQPTGFEDDDQKPLKQVPDILPGEQQLPSGDGLPPVSQPSLPGYEPDLPAREVPDDDQ